MSISGSSPWRGKGNAMQNINHGVPEEIEESPNERRIKSRTRTVDFMRIEDTGIRQTLSPFELKVKEAITSYKTPLTELTEPEDERDYKELFRNLYRLALKSGLTPTQRKCFELVYRKNMSNAEAARILKVYPSRVAKIKTAIGKKLKVHILPKLRGNKKLRNFLLIFPGFRISFLDKN